MLARSAEDVLQALSRLGEPGRLAIAAAARERILAEHTAGHRAAELEALLHEAALAVRRKDELLLC